MRNAQSFGMMVRLVRLIRDAASPMTGADLERLAGTHPELRHFFPSTLAPIINRLIDANVIELMPDGGLRVSSSATKTFEALTFSLSDFAAVEPGSVIAQPVFGSGKRKSTAPDVFVVMPFSPEIRIVYDRAICEACHLARVSVGRADTSVLSRHILEEIWSSIRDCKIVIADCTGGNPNVFYEIGIAHTLGKPTILTTPLMEEVPFDLRAFRCLNYQMDEEGLLHLRAELAALVEATMLDLEQQRFAPARDRFSNFSA